MNIFLLWSLIGLCFVLAVGTETYEKTRYDQIHTNRRNSKNHETKHHDQNHENKHHGQSHENKHHGQNHENKHHAQTHGNEHPNQIYENKFHGLNHEHKLNGQVNFVGRHHYKQNTEEAETSTPLITSDASSIPSEVISESSSLPSTITSDGSSELLVTTVASTVNDNKALANYDGFNLLFNCDEGMMGFANVTNNVGLVWLLRKEGSLILVLDSKTGNIMRYQHIDKITRIQNKEFCGNILDVTYQILTKYEYQNATVPGDSSVILPSSEEGLSVLSEVFLHLGHPREKGDTSHHTFKFLIKFVGHLKNVYNGPLKGLITGKGPLPLKQNLNRFVSITTGLQSLFNKARGGLRTILKKNVKFDLNELFNAKNGAEVLAYILRQTGAKFDLAKLWGPLLNDIAKLLRIIELLGGGESKNGVDETFSIIGHVWSALNSQIGLPDLIKYLTEASSEQSWSNADDGDFSKVLRDFKNVTDEQAKKYDNSGALSPFVVFTTNLTAQTLIHDGVNISDIVVKWRKRDVIGGLKFVADVFLKFGSPEKYSNLLFNSYVSFLNSSSDPEALKRLVPGISPEQLTDKGSSLWDSISKTYKVDSLLKNKGNPNDILNNVPAFGEFSKIYKDALGNPYNFTKSLNGSTVTEYLTKNLFVSPVKWTYDSISHAITGTGSFIKHIFWDPFKPLIPGLNKNPQTLPIESIPSILNPTKSDPQVKPSTEKPCDEGEKCEPTTSKKPCGDDCEGQETSIKTVTETKDTDVTNGDSTSKDCGDDCDGTKSTLNTATEATNTAVTENGITVKTVSDDDTTITTTKKDCGDNCDDENVEATSEKQVTVESQAIDYKNHRQNKYHARHHVDQIHHAERKHHELKNKHNEKDHSQRAHHDSKMNHHNRRYVNHEKKTEQRSNQKLAEKNHNEREQKIHHLRTQQN